MIVPSWMRGFFTTGKIATLQEVCQAGTVSHLFLPTMALLPRSGVGTLFAIDCPPFTIPLQCVGVVITILVDSYDRIGIERNHVGVLCDVNCVILVCVHA